MRPITKCLLLLAMLSVLAPYSVLADGEELPPNAAMPIVVAPDEYLRGTVTGIAGRTIDGTENEVQELTIRIESGTDKGRDIMLTNGGVFADPETGVKQGDRVVVVRAVAGNETSYYLADRYRFPWVIGLIVLLVVLAIATGGKRGATATLGLAASVGILALIVLPQIADGGNPIVITLLGGIGIAAVTTFIAHGFRRESGLILGSILAALGVGTLAAYLATLVLRLSGGGSDVALSLTYGPLGDIDLRALLIAGIVLGVLGVLDDVAATQVAAAKEIAAADPRMTARELYRSGMRVGKEHVAALINTLFLAYTGASLPLLLVVMVNLKLPVWAFINNQAIAEEIVRTVVGSGALILTVPIATALASWHFARHHAARKKQS